MFLTRQSLRPKTHTPTAAVAFNGIPWIQVEEELIDYYYIVY